MASVALAYTYQGNPPTFGISYEVPNTKPPSVCSFAWDWVAYDANFFNDIRINKDTITMHCNLPSSGVSGAGLDMVKSVYIDNSHNYFPVTITALDTQQTVFCGPLQSGWFPIATNQFNFDVSTFLGITTVLPVGVTSAPIQIVFCNTVIPGDITSATSLFDIYNKLDVLHQDLLNIENNYLQEIINLMLAQSSAFVYTGNTLLINQTIPANSTVWSPQIIPQYPTLPNIQVTSYNMIVNLNANASVDVFLYGGNGSVQIPMWRGVSGSNAEAYVYNNPDLNFQLPTSTNYTLELRNYSSTPSQFNSMVNINWRHI